jgi:hypothetical protein
MVLLVLVGDDEPLGKASVGQDGNDDGLIGQGTLEALVQQVGVGARVKARGGEHGRLELRGEIEKHKHTYIMSMSKRMSGQRSWCVVRHIHTTVSRRSLAHLHYVIIINESDFTA